ncbi:MAG TPA: DEAD/DEAH box helicase family protein [Pyrinomonadaceae bacterium]|nr:DEAD/DEAH box helicase family protein [Pyrinomonadaceae bacterium]
MPALLSECWRTGIILDIFDKKNLTERDICTKFITPAVVETAGWDRDTQIREELSLTKGRIVVRGKLYSRGERKRADYVLYHKTNIPLAVIEAKDNTNTMRSGIQQAIQYAEMLDVPFAYSSNGDGFIEHDRSVESGPRERELSLSEFPTPQELWRRYCEYKGIDDPEEKKIVTQDYYPSPENKTPRYYQLTAVNRTIEAIAKGQNRVLLVMATGTGKTFTAFQIIWRLWKSGTKKRILFLADRNILVDQTRTNDFKPFGSAMTKIQKRQADKSYEVYLALYQAITGTEEQQKIYKEFSKNFFDLIVVDECHRGSAEEDSAWREILEYFSGATQIGMTATPRETKYVSNIDYFGDPVFLYSLKQGIQDGFLAPYKVIRIDLDKDLTGWRPEHRKKDRYGKEIPDRIYNQSDFDQELVLEKRNEVVAKKVTEYLKATDRFDKTILFCEDIPHAERMRSLLINENSDLYAQNSKYVMQMTGDNPEGKAELDNFVLPESKYPVIVTTSKLLSTGVDIQTCKLIVLDKRIESLTEFKQIIGRGTRINEVYGKVYFTIIDFRKATELFADKDFDGDPVQIYEPKDDDPIVPPDEGADPIDDGEMIIDEGVQVGPKGKGVRRTKYFVHDVEVNLVSERVQYYGKDGKLITESLKDYTRKAVQKNFTALNDFLNRWSDADKKQAIIDELENEGVLLEALSEEVGRDFDAFDLVCHVAFGQKPLTRRERAENVRKRNYFAKYEGAARAVLEALLDKYADEGLSNIEDPKVLKIQPFDQYGTPAEIVRAFGGKEKYFEAVRELENKIYAAA